jgi:hypothetical protein
LAYVWETAGRTELTEAVAAALDGQPLISCEKDVLGSDWSCKHEKGVHYFMVGKLSLRYISALSFDPDQCKGMKAGAPNNYTDREGDCSVDFPAGYGKFRNEAEMVAHEVFDARRLPQ